MVVVSDTDRIKEIISECMEMKYKDPYLTEVQAINYLGVSPRYFREIKSELDPIVKSRTLRYYHIDNLIEWKGR